MHERAGTKALPQDLIDVDHVIRAYHEVTPDPGDPRQRVAFGTSGHRGTSLDGSFNEAHIAAISLAIAEYRAREGVTGPLYLGADTHPLSAPAEATARAVLAAAGVDVRVSRDGEFVPTPALSRAILAHNDPRAGNALAADGIVITPSHNPPADGGFKYNPPHGGPADTDATGWIAARANELLETGTTIPGDDDAELSEFDFLRAYVDALPEVIDLDAIQKSGLRIGAHPLGGAANAYWSEIARVYELDLTVLGPGIDPRWAFMTLDWDGKIRMDPSSRFAMAVVAEYRESCDLVVANDADADRFGIVTPDAGLMTPNDVLAVAVDYLLRTRTDWPASVAVGKTLVSSRMIDRVVEQHGRELVEVPVGFKWFVPGLSRGTLGFGGEESAGASFLTRDGRAWSTDKDGIIMGLLAAEITAVTGRTPSQRFAELEREFGSAFYARTDVAADRDDKARLAALSATDVTATELAGDPITRVLTEAPGNAAPIGGVKVETEHAWFAARPSGTEDVYKVYAESFRSEAHLDEVASAAQQLVTRALASEH